LEAFNDDLLGYWGLESDYSGIFFAIIGFWCDMTWSIADIFLVVLSVILTRYFIRFNRALRMPRTAISVLRIQELYREYQEICSLVKVNTEIIETK